MARYRITIDNLDNASDEPTVRVIECTSDYTLREDISEWVTEEVDPDAFIEDQLRTESPVRDD
jgi:hypothetical protein